MNILRHPATIVVLILLVLLLFRSKRLPDMARSVGQSLKIFKKEVKDLREDSDRDDNNHHHRAPATTAPTTTTGATGAVATSVTGARRRPRGPTPKATMMCRP